MCLTIPKKVLEIKENSVVVVENPNGSKQDVKTIVPVLVGDFVLTQQGIVIEKIETKEAQEILAILQGKESCNEQ